MTDPVYELPMFPLEQTVLPSTLVPLHIFEPRYRELARVVTEREEPEFGLAMIERGREVGGDDQRAAIGVVGRVVQFEEFPDGRWGVVVAATRRLRVDEWLPDDPFPRAMVTDWPDGDASDYLTTIDPETGVLLAAGLERIDRAAQRLEPGYPGAPITLDDDPAQATWQAAVRAQLGPLDAMRLLGQPTATARAALAIELIDERADVLEALADQAG